MVGGFGRQAWWYGWISYHVFVFAKYISLQPASICKPCMHMAHPSHPEDVAALSDDVTIHSSSFKSESAKGVFKHLHFHPSAIVDDRKSWPSTSPGSLELSQCLLMLAMRCIPEEQWPTMWMSSVFRTNMIISRVGSGACFYVLLAGPKVLVLMELAFVGESEVCFDLSPDAFSITAPESLDQFECWDYAISFDADCSKVSFSLLKGWPLFTYAVRNYVTSLKATLLRALAKEMGLKIPPKVSRLDIIQQMVDSDPTLSDADKKKAVDEVRKMLEKRMKKMAAKADPENDEEGDNDKGGAPRAMRSPMAMFTRQRSWPSTSLSI